MLIAGEADCPVPRSHIRLGHDRKVPVMARGSRCHRIASPTALPDHPRQPGRDGLGREDRATLRAMTRTDSASRFVDAPVGRVFDALVRREALETWLPPGDMTGRFEWFDPTPGGSYRLVLTYSDPSGSQAKSSEDSDIVDVRYVDIVPNDRVVQAVDFVADAPEFAGTMTMTWSVNEEVGGTRVEIVAQDVPDGISADDHAVGLASSLDNLARFVEL